MIRRALLAFAVAASVAAAAPGVAAAAPGDLDAAFGDGGISTERLELPTGLRLAQRELETVGDSGKLLTAGVYGAPGHRGLAVVRFLENGRLDKTFGGGDGIAVLPVLPVLEGAGGGGYALEQLPDGRIVLAGTIHAHPDGVAGLLLARLHPDGTRDTTLDGDGLKVLPARYGLTVIDLALQSTGRMVLAQSEDIAIHDPYSRTARIRRFEADGTPDESFAPQLPVEVDEFSGLLVDGQDRIVVHDYSDVLRLLPGGAPDPSFASGGTARQPLQRLRAGLQPGGGLVLAGVRRRGAGRGTAVVRLTASGAVDPGFGVDGVARIPDLAHRDVAFASDGSVLVGGGAYYPAVFDMGVARLDPSGCLDTAFGEDGYATASFDDDGRALEAGALAVQPSGRVVAADQDFVSHGGSPVSFRSYAFALAGWQGAAGPVPGGCGPAPSAASEASWFAPALGWSGGFAGLARRPAR